MMKRGLLVYWFIGLLVVGCRQSRPSNQPTRLPTIQPTIQPTVTEQNSPTPSPISSLQSPSIADADVTFVRAVETKENVWTFHVTLKHPDTGWEDYADGWDVLLPDDTVVKRNLNDPFTRLLVHPHEQEQPFTRSQSGLIIPADVTKVTVRAHDLVAGFGGQEIVVDLTAVGGDGFEVER